MWNKEIYEAMDDEEYLFGKLTNDGGFNHVFFKEQHLPSRKKSYKPIEEKVDVPISSLVEAKKRVYFKRGQATEERLNEWGINARKGE